MPELHVRPFGPSDLATVVALWNRCLPKDTITEERFWQLFLLDANFDRAGALVAEAGAEPGAGGKIVGFICVIARRFPLGKIGLEPEKGYMTAFFVDPAWRRRGVGTALLVASGLDAHKGFVATAATYDSTKGWLGKKYPAVRFNPYPRWE